MFVCLIVVYYFIFKKDILAKVGGKKINKSKWSVKKKKDAYFEYNLKCIHLTYFF